VKRQLVAPLVALALGLSTVSCGDTSAASESTVQPSGAGFPVEVAGTVIPAFPQRIVSVSASHTEILYAIGAGDRVVATDEFSNYPAEAASTPKLDAFNLSVEAVASLSPDLVVLSFDPDDVQTGLAALGIPSLLLGPPSSLEDVYGQIQALGEAAGCGSAAAALVASMQAEVAATLAAVPSGAPGLTYYYELDPTLYSLTSATFVGSLLARLGLENIADPADAQGGGYPQLSAEYILAADPDFILLADTKCCGQSVESLAARPGWDRLGAVAGGRVLALDDDVASRWGPRVVDLLAQVEQGVYGGAG
jgi:iron complex transport system substrate-binding protein